MYVARVNDNFIVKRMPGTGISHDSACDHFDAPENLSGLGDVMGRAIKQQDDGNTTLKFDFSLTKVGKRAAVAASDSKADTVKSDASKLTLLGLLHFLWHEAGLNKWSSRFNGRRNWPMVYSRITEAAAAKETKKTPLLERLYMPEPYYRDKAKEIDARRTKQLAPFLPTSSNRTEMLIYVGELKNIEPTRFGSKLTIRHAPQFPIFMDEKTEASVRKRFEMELAMAEADDRLKLVVIATTSINKAGSAQLAEIAIMVTTENWIPVEDMSQFQLIDQLTADERNFTKTLRFNVKNRPIATALLTDVKPACAMYVLPADSDEVYKEIVAGIEAETGMPTWLWDTEDGGWPAIPIPA